jgi:exosortase
VRVYPIPFRLFMNSVKLRVMRAARYLKQNGWRAAALGATWLWLFSDVIRRLVDDWRVDENYSHGFLIPFISAYAIWSQRERLAQLELNPRLGLGGAAIVFSVLFHLAGVLSGELYASRLALVLSLAGLTLYFGGWAWLRALWFPLGLLLFALPVPSLIFNPLAFRLQLLASDYATRAIQLCGIPALREGNLIELAHLKLEVVEACSGIRSLMTLATLAVVYGYFFESSWWRRAVLILAVAPIAVLTNAARVAITGVVAHTQGAHAAEGFLHSFSGTLVFITAVLLLLATAKITAKILDAGGHLLAARRVITQT